MENIFNWLVLLIFKNNKNLKEAILLDQLMQNLQNPENTLPHRLLFDGNLIYHHMPMYKPLLLERLKLDGLIGEQDSNGNYKVLNAGLHRDKYGYFNAFKKDRANKYFGYIGIIFAFLLGLSEFLTNILQLVHYCSCK